jgi:hypothetical protein
MNLTYLPLLVMILVYKSVLKRGSISTRRFGPGGPYLLGDLDRGSKSTGGSKSAVTPVAFATKGSVYSASILFGTPTS